jgi:hypothetical protein
MRVTLGDWVRTARSVTVRRGSSLAAVKLVDQQDPYVRSMQESRELGKHS